MTGPHGEYLEANRRHWDETVAPHAGSAFYDTAGFRAGRCTLDPLDVAEVGDVRGLDLLHLQCHFGLDTLSWARRGARVTGVDFAPAAVAQAQALAEEAGLPARFVEANLYDLPRHLPGAAFDLVYTGGGVLSWLPDLPAWARVVAHFVRPGGRFYLREIHPFSLVWDDSEAAPGLRPRYDYFRGPEPERWEQDGTYADPAARLRHRVTYNWPYPLGEVVTVLLDAGLTLRWLREHDFTCYEQIPGMQQDAEGHWRLPNTPSLPWSFSLLATR